VRAVDLDKVRDAFYGTYVIASDQGTTEEQHQNSRRKAFSRALEKAQVQKLIAARALENGRQIVWIVGPGRTGTTPYTLSCPSRSGRGSPENYPRPVRIPTWKVRPSVPVSIGGKLCLKTGTRIGAP
jgi:hypothetical protein